MTLRKSDRLFQLTNILRAHQPITAKQLAARLSVSERTIYRYIDDLSLSGIPVYGEAGIGYRLSEGFELPPLQLSHEEMEALILGVNMVASRTGTGLAKTAYSLLNKIEASIPLSSTQAHTTLAAHVCKLEHNETLQKYWDAVHHAIKQQHWLNIQYHALSDETTKRSIYPLGLFYWEGKWTLASWCQLRSDYRNFRLDRIINLQKSNLDSLLPEHVNLSNYIAIQTANPEQH